MPLPWQIQPWRDKSKVVLCTGAAGGGKSRFAAEKLHAYLLKYPRATGLMMRKTRQSMTNSTVLMFDREVAQGGCVHVSSKNRFEYPNGSLLAYGGMADDEQKEQIRSIGQAGGVDVAWLEEANRFSEDDFNEVLARLRGNAAPWRQVLLTTNPDSPIHWIKRRLIDGQEAKVYYSKAADNTYNPDDYQATLAALTGVTHRRLVEGLWVQAEGVVYEGFDDELHHIDPFPIPAHWRRFRSIDFGYTNPFVCQWWAADNDGRLYLYRELYRTRRTIAEHAPQIKRLSEGETIETTICDHDAEDRATLYQNGIPNGPADKRLSVGIERVTERLKRAGDGRPRLFVFKNALVEMDLDLDHAKRPTMTYQEFVSYIWPTGASGKPVKETPVDLDNHGMDALRYAVMYEDNRQAQALPKPKHREVIG